MDGIESSEGVIVIACTTDIERVDDALLRPGRLDHHIHIPYPNHKDICIIITSLMAKLHFALIDKGHNVYDQLIEIFDGQSVADIVSAFNSYAADNIREPLPLNLEKFLNFIKSTNNKDIY